MTNFSEATIPWVPIDCNLFLPWQIRKERVPCTFPAVLEKDLALMAQKEQEAKAKKSKMNKKKGKKKYKGKAEGFTPRKPKPEHATQQSSDIADQGRKPQNTKSQLQVPTLLGVVASVCTSLPTRTQQLPTLLGQQF